MANLISILIAILALGVSIANAFWSWKSSRPVVTVDDVPDASLKNQIFRVRVNVRSRSNENYRLDWVEVREPQSMRLFGIEAAVKAQRQDVYRGEPTIDGQAGFLKLPMRPELDPKGDRFPHNDIQNSAPEDPPYQSNTSEDVIVFAPGLRSDAEPGNSIELVVAFRGDADPRRIYQANVKVAIRNTTLWA